MMEEEIEMHEDESNPSHVRNAGRKRSRDDKNGGESTPTVTDLCIEDNESSPPTGPQTTVLPPIKSLSLEAIFHPKFENENANDQSIRCQMKENVLRGKGYIEVSLKHSGSLLLWSGGQRYYSKNSMDNQFTYVGEILLRQHFYRAHFDQHPAAKDECVESPVVQQDSPLEAHYQTCSDYVQANRLTLSFEVVTAILGHHGDIPSRDFLILTAVADRNKERFYSTCELVQFAQRFRLPHNDTWIFDSQDSVKGLFLLYDTTRETGLAEDTIAALNDLANMHVTSMYPHPVFQGNILEGIVIRYVSYHDKAEEQTTLQGLAQESERILQLVPPEMPPSFVLARNDKGVLPSVLTTDLRELTRNVMATGDRDTMSSFLERSALDIFRSSDGEEQRRHVERKPPGVVGNPDWTSDNFPITLRRLLLGNETLDQESRRILKLVETLGSLKARVDYRLVKETMFGRPDRWLCIVHVLYDTTHQKYRRAMENSNDMMLFRGFCIELGTDHKDEAIKVDKSCVGEDLPTVADSEVSCLMLKMKFLPYMVRTFGCRNGLQVISQKGSRAFTKYAMNLMARWGMSVKAMAKWQPFFAAWGKYAHLCLTKEEHQYSNMSLPKLCDAYYLEHLEHFTSLYDRGEIVGDVEEQMSSNSTFRGLIFVIGLSDKADLVADAVSEKLGGLIIRRGLRSLDSEDWDAACLSRRVGIICSASALDPTKFVRKKVEDCGEAMFGVLVGCDEVGILSYEAEHDEAVEGEKVNGSVQSTKKLRGMIKAWETTRFAKLSKISSENLAEDSAFDNTIQKAAEDLQSASDALPRSDGRPGLFVFFPSIPGSGKSSLCSTDTEEKLRRVCRQSDVAESKDKAGDDAAPPRRVIVRVGDEVKRKYWPLVRVERTKNPSSVYVADKNAPPPSWDYVAQVCSVSNGVAVPVIPGGGALQTTSVEGAGHYPFSLPFLAVSISRVVSRPAKSHSGKLDKSTDLACMVVVKFFALYRNMTAEELITSIQGAMRRKGASVSSSPIVVPFFATESLPELPSDLMDALKDALRIQYDMAFDEKLTRENPKVDEIETRLRNLIEKHNHLLSNLTADPPVSKQSFVSQVVEQLAALPSSLEDLPQGQPFVKIASIDVSQTEVHSALNNVTDKYPRLQTLLIPKDGNDSSSDDRSILPDSYVGDTHVTMAHFSQATQSTIRSQFEPLTGCVVDVKITGILWNNEIAALAVQVASDTNDKPGVPVPAAKNAFPHITLRHKPEVSAARSNDLPQLVEDGKAERVDFEDPLIIQGTVSLWGEDRG